MDEAKDKVKRFLATKRRRDKIMLVRMDSQVTPITSWNDCGQTLRRAVDKIKASDTPADYSRALRFATDTLKPLKDPILVVVTDGGFDQSSLSTVYWGKRMPEDLLLQTGKKKPRARPRPRPRPPEAARPKPEKKKRRKARRRRRKKEKERPKPKKAPKPPPLGGGAFLDPIAMGGIPVHAIKVGRSTNNIGIVAFNARRHLADKLNYEVFARIKNYRKKPATVQIQLYSGGVIPDTALMHLQPGETKSFIKRELPAAGANLTVKLSPPPPGKGRLDDFPLDDVAYALIPQRSKSKVLLVTAGGNLYLEGALLLDENTSYDSIPHKEYKPSKAKKYDAVIFDDYHGEPLPSPGNYMLFNPDPKKSPITVKKQVANPPIFWPSEPKHKRHPIMKFVTLKNVNTVKASIFKLEDGDKPLMMTDERGPVFAAVRRRAGLRIVTVGFSLKQTDWVVRVSFPIFVMDCLNWFAGVDPRLIKSHRTGRTWEIPVDVPTEHVDAEDPLKRRFIVPVQGGNALIYGRHVGYYTLYAGRRRVKVAGNLANPYESDIVVPEKIRLGGAKHGKDLSPPALAATADEGKKISTGTWVMLGLLLAIGIALVVLGLTMGATGPLWVLLGLAVLALSMAALFYLQDFYLWTCLLVGALMILMLEWLTYNRRVTV
jgi:hypothetical protein